jgi:hypothetical protein
MRKSSAVRALLGLQARLRPDVLFLSETHLCKATTENLKRRLLFDEVLVAESDGRSGGLVMFWNKDITVTSKEVDTNFIDIRIDENEVAGWRLTGFYGEPSSDRKHSSWDYLRSLHTAIDLPWIVMGDFNEILYSAEKEGGAMRPQRCMQGFRDALNVCYLEDMGYEGEIFTWRRGQIRERLDRDVCNSRWAAMFPLAGVVNENFDKSDHRPILVDTKRYASMQRSVTKPPMRFEARWLCENFVETIIQTAWDRAKEMHAEASLCDHTKEVHEALHNWDRNVLEGPRKRLRELQTDLNKILSGPLSDESVSKKREIQLQIENLLEQEELYWVQRGRINWLKHGDQNTAFFHRPASERRKRNHINQLKTDTGDIIDDQDQLLDLASNYFQHLFTAEVQEPNQAVLDKVVPCVTHDMNAKLLAPFTREEVKKALFNMGDMKAPGPDGLHAI